MLAILVILFTVFVTQYSNVPGSHFCHLVTHSNCKTKYVALLYCRYTVLYSCHVYACACMYMPIFYYIVIVITTAASSSVLVPNFVHSFAFYCHNHCFAVLFVVSLYMH